ncbi:coiled-coil domain-containing protein 175 [Stegostoma tigrinum]|uniref:coiled-coil domain-containing protein 175 n=1 Tax=Stegostoma tigrinum TaxID=3053191 RepID=UPI0028708B96|nr:coiled-coil domain-containing protein 175 [Stegostoma tigrinum]
MVCGCHGDVYCRSGSHWDSVPEPEQPLTMKRYTKLRTVRVVMERLQELEKRLKHDNFCFNHETIRNFAQITKGVSQLEEVRRNIREVLEVETIEASNLRHKLNNLPNNLKQQMTAAILAARQSKATRVKELQTKIESLTQQIESLEKEYNRLEKENASLCPVRQKEGAQHANVVDLLNDVMDKRTSGQITLNETYDNIRDIQQKVIFTKKDITSLKYALDEKRRKFEADKEFLAAQLENVQLLIQNQNAATVEKRRKLDEMNMELQKLNDNLTYQEKVNENLEMQIKNLDKNELNLQTNYSEDLELAEQLNAQKQYITKELNNLLEIIREEAEILHRQILKAKKNKADAQMLNEELLQTSDSRHDALKKAKEYELETKANLQNMKQRLDVVKDLLAVKEEHVSQIRKQNQEFEEEILSLQEKHKDNMEFLHGEFQKYMHKFDKEEQLRAALQSRKESISKSIMHIKATTEDYLTHLSMHMKTLKKKREGLLPEIKRIQLEINTYTEKIVALKQQLAEEKAAYSSKEEHLLAEFKQLKNEIENLNRTINQVKEELQEKISTQKTLESMLAEESAACDELHKEREVQKNEKHELDKAITQIKAKTEMVLSSKTQLKRLLAVLRNSLYNQVKSTADQLKFMEVDIYEASRRLEQVEIENCKLKLCKFQLLRVIASLKEDGEKQNTAKNQQDSELQIIYDNLLNSWSLDSSVQKESLECEQDVLNTIQKLMQRIYHRIQTVGYISNQLKQYLSKLQSFVGATRPTEEKGRCMMEQITSPQ